MTFEEALVEDKGKVETRRQKLEWGDAGLPGKSDRDAESAKARRYVARQIAVTLEGAEKVER